MKDAQKEGKIRSLGASIDGELARQSILSGDFDVMQMEYHLLNQVNEENIKLCDEKGIGVLIRTGLGRGLLTSRALQAEMKPAKLKQLLELVNNDGDLLSSHALNFLYENKGINSVLIATKNWITSRKILICLKKKWIAICSNRQFK